MPWCPKCSAEYRGGFTECSDCLVLLTDKQPEATERAPREKATFDTEFPGLTTRSWLLVSVLFMMLYHWAEIQLTWRVFGLLAPFISFEAYRWLVYIAPPILLGLLFFAGVYIILHRRSPASYFTRRNIVLCILITAGDRFLVRPAFFLLFSFLFPAHIFSDPFGVDFIAIASLGMVIIQLPSIIALALIYSFTIGGLTFRQLLLSKAAIGALVISVLHLTAQGLYLVYFFPESLLLPSDIEASAISGDYTLWLFRLHLLWAGILLGRVKGNGPPDGSPAQSKGEAQ